MGICRLRCTVRAPARQLSVQIPGEPLTSRDRAARGIMPAFYRPFTRPSSVYPRDTETIKRDPIARDSARASSSEPSKTTSATAAAASSPADLFFPCIDDFLFLFIFFFCVSHIDTNITFLSRLAGPASVKSMLGSWSCWLKLLWSGKYRSGHFYTERSAW